ncbi:MAG: sugar transferase [Spirochaetia bacterium]|nr:sugar transferase [Spirochaetia bacterium]
MQKHLSVFSEKSDYKGCGIMKQKGFSFFLKRIFDYLFGITLLVCAFPFFLLAALVVKIASPEAPVLFKQERIGYQCKPFVIKKLRTMTNDSDEKGRLLSDEKRLKKWGIFIRKTNLDEIPQIWNILKGEMSLIGPRPLLYKEMKIMSEEEQKKRQSVLPGITGWEAVNERKARSRRIMAEYDLFYVNNWSIKIDFKIFIKTVAIIVLNQRPADNIRAPKIDEELNSEFSKKVNW